jgi:hypothetical protein
VTNKKSRAGWHQQTAFNTAFGKRHFTHLASLMKALILTLAVWGWLPMAVADRFIDQGGPHDE